MAGGALEMMQQLLKQRQAGEQSAYADSDSAANAAIGALSRPRQNQNRGALALAAGLLSPTRSGSFGEGLGKGVSGYSDALDKTDAEDMDVATKIAAIRQAQAGLRLRGAHSAYNAGMDAFGFPEKAVKFRDDMDDLNDDGESDIPAFPGSAPAKRSDATQAPSAAPASAPAPAPGLPPGTTPPNANVGSLEPVARMAQAQEAGLPPGDLPGDDAVNFPQTGGQTAALGDGPVPSGLEPPAPAAPAPQQMAQAQPGQTPAAPAAPSLEQQQYEWALSVRQAAMANSKKWARKPALQRTLGLAEKVIDDYRQGQSQLSMQTMREMALRSKESELETKKTLAEMRDPYTRGLATAEADTVAKARENAGQAGKSIENLRVVEELRKRPVATGPAGQYLTKFLDIAGMGGGQALEGRGADLWVQATEPLKGALSNQEGARFDAANPASLSMNDPEANILLRLGKESAKRLQQKSSFLETYRRENGTLEGAESTWSRFLEERPILKVDDKTGNPMWLTQNIDAWRSYTRNPDVGRRRGATDSTPGTDVPQIKSVEDYNALPPGPYIDPNGVPRVKR